MKATSPICLAAMVLLLGNAVCGAEWDHYQVILDRHPFGMLRDTTNAAPDYAKSLRLSAIWQVHGQPRAGFEDSAAKHDFVLTCGESTEDGLQLVEIRYADESVVVRKGTEVAVLHLQAGASTNIPPINVGPPSLAGQPGAAVNPWREFYERYRQQRRDERANQMQQQGMPGGQPDVRFGGQTPAPVQVFVQPVPARPVITESSTEMSPTRRSRRFNNSPAAAGY